MSAYIFSMRYPAVAVLEPGKIVKDEHGVERERLQYLDLPTNQRGQQIVPLGRIAEAWLRHQAGMLPAPGTQTFAPSGHAFQASQLDASAKRVQRIHEVSMSRGQTLDGSDLCIASFRVKSIAEAERTPA